MAPCTKYRSAWDAFTWVIIAFTAACCLWPLLLDNGWLPVIISAISLGFILCVFCGIYYAVDGDRLLVYTFFRPTSYPIAKIKEIKATNSILSAPAASVTGRIAIKFTDRSVLKSTLPLVISPADRDRFIRQLLSINPDIKTDLI